MYGGSTVYAEEPIHDFLPLLPLPDEGRRPSWFAGEPNH